MEGTTEKEPTEQNEVANVKTESEKEVIDPLDVNKHPKIIKDAQSDLGKLDILVCGQCHNVFHFIEQFQEHKLMGNCTGVSPIRENNINETKAQVWAFLLWKGSQNIDENENSWVVYQRWCKMDTNVKEAWITAGRNVQVFTKLSAAKMQEVRAKVTPAKKSVDDSLEEGEIKRTGKNSTKKTYSMSDFDEPESESEVDTEEEAEKQAELEKLKKTQNNGTTEVKNSPEKKTTETDKDKKVTTTPATNAAQPVVKRIQTPTDKASRIAKRTDKINNTEKEMPVEKILAKRFNPRRKLHEYLIKWEGQPHDLNTWEPAANLDTCKHLLETFEKNLARQKEQKAAAAAAQAQLAKQQQKENKNKPGTSATAATTPGGRPQRVCKQKALNQVKQWCGNITDRDDDLKRVVDSDSEDDMNEKRIKLEYDSGSEDEWTGEGPHVERTGLPGRPRILSKSANTVNGVAKKMTANEIAKSIGLASPDRTDPPKQIVKVVNRSQTNLPSGVYMVNRKDGTLTSTTPGTPSIVRVVQKTSTGQQIVRVGPKVGNTPVRIVQKTDGSGVVRLSPGMSKIGLNQSPKPGLVRTQVRPQIRVVQTTPGQKLGAQRMTIGTPQLKVVSRGKAPPTKTAPAFEEKTDDKDSESSEDEFDPFPADLPPPGPPSPPREFTLDPMTGLIVGQAEGEPEPTIQEPPKEPEIKISTPINISTSNDATTSDSNISIQISGTTDSNKDLNLPALIKAPEVQQQQKEVTSISGPSMPDPENILAQSVPMETENQPATISLPETSEESMVVGEDGLIYRVAGQNEEGQTLLVAHGADGEQQCVYVTSTAVDESQTTTTTTTNVLTLDGAVAEAVQDTTENQQEQLTVDTSEGGVVLQQGEGEGDGQVVAQLVKAELPSPGGTRKVVFLLPDGNFLMTEVDAEQYAALELDK